MALGGSKDKDICKDSFKAANSSSSIQVSTTNRKIGGVFGALKMKKNNYLDLIIQKLFSIALKEEFLTLDSEVGPFLFRNKDAKGYKNICRLHGVL